MGEIRQLNVCRRCTIDRCSSRQTRRQSKAARLGSALLIVFLIMTEAHASPNSPTGSLYYYIPGEFTWTEARADAEARGGHLATITSEAENIIVSQLSPERMWIGGFQEPGGPEPRAGWRWITDEPFAYTNWFNGQPDNLGFALPVEDWLMVNFGMPGQWNDEAQTTRIGYALEVPAPRAATARLQIVNGFIVGADILDGGYAYSQPPAVTVIGGGGTNAILTAVIEDGRVTRIVVENPGRSYDNNTTVLIEAPPIPPRRAVATAEVTNGSLVSVTIVDPGFGYTEAPAVRLLGGDGSGAQVIAEVANGSVTAISILDAGEGYSASPRVLIAKPPTAPDLAIQVSRVSVRLRVTLGRKYLLETSKDLRTWSAALPVFVAEAEELDQEFDVGEAGRYFRISEVP